MRISRLSHIKGKAEAFDVDWPTLAGWILTHVETTDKHSIDAWTPAFFGERISRVLKVLVQGVSALVLDVDHGPSSNESIISVEDVIAVSQRLRAEGIEHVMASSYSYLMPGKGARMRFVIPLRTPLDPKRWPTFWRITAARYAPSVSQTLGTYADQQCIDPGHKYFRSSCPPGAPRVALHVPGRPIDPEEVLYGIPLDSEAEGTKLEACHSAQVEDLRDIVRKWQRRKEAPLLWALRALVAGDRFAEDGSKDITAANLCFAIIREAPHLTTDSLADLFAPSLQAMRVSFPEYRPSLVDKIERGRAYREEAKVRKEKTVRERPIVQTIQEKIYLKVGARYVGPFTRKQMVETIRERLPDEVADNRIVLADHEGKPLNDGAIIDRYGQTVLEISYEIGRQEDALEPIPTIPNEKRLVLGCACRNAEPRYVPEVEAFLSVLCTNKKQLDDLKTWLVVAKTKPMETLAALQFIGPKGVGKNLLANAIAQLWADEPPVEAVEAFSQFNARLADMPFIFVDEGLPISKHGQVSFSQAFRSMISKTSIKVEKKGLMPTNAKGAVRILMAANHASSLTFEESFHADDIEAVADRIYRIHVDPIRVDYVAPRIDKTDPDSDRIWPPGFTDAVKYGMLPHVMNLSFYGKLEQQGRFWIRGEREEIKRDLQTQGAMRDCVLQWIASWIFEPMKAEAGITKLKTRVDFEGRILIASHEVVEHWHAYLPVSRSVPSILTVGKTLSVFSKRGKREETTAGRVRLHEVDKNVLLRWLEVSGRASKEEFEEAVEKVRRKLTVVK